jgi:hypothetical protein
VQLPYLSYNEGTTRKGSTMTEFTHDNDARSKIKAIETEYKGYKFRSRLEARWAVFFDTLGIDWVYEVEGFNVQGFGWYLPDFYLPHVKQFCEVKPEYIEHDNELYNKLKAFVKTTGFEIVLLNGTPDCVFYKYFWTLTNGNIATDLEFISDHHQYYTKEKRFYSSPGTDSPYKEQIVGPEYIDAVNAARSARFEYGEVS